MVILQAPTEGFQEQTPLAFLAYSFYKTDAAQKGNVPPRWAFLADSVKREYMLKALNAIEVWNDEERQAYDQASKLKISPSSSPGESNGTNLS